MFDTSCSDPNQNTAILLDSISVKYRIPSESIKTLKEYLIQLIQGKITHKSFLALNQVSLEVQKGEIFGIVGRNGAGKSTLLKVISKVLIPSTGRVWIKGAISPLLQLGAGFHPELTGMENIYLNATLLGHSRDSVDEKLQGIIDFAEVGNFIQAPLRTYSSGMQARLGFAVATAWHPDILILDEVLSVGDVAFQQKCFDRMAGFRESGSTVLMVSHSIDQIRNHCQRAMWLNQGEIQAIGTAEDVSNAYRDHMSIPKKD
jgi:ABC-2 type transport system ATP-binding protein